MAREIVKKVKNAVLYSDGCIRIDNVRASYPHLDKAWAKNESDRPKFSITGLAPKETHGEAKKLLVEEIDKLLTSSKIGKLASEHKFVRNGDDSGKEEAEGHWIIKASENPDRRPSCRTPRGTVMTPDEIAEKIYPGCWVNIFVRPWAQNNQHGKKINANLIAVQFVRDGERFGEGSIDDEDVWDELDDAEGDGYDFGDEGGDDDL
ncbi:ssDNA-binding protein [Pseudomonas aeruginosa]